MMDTDSAESPEASRQDKEDLKLAQVVPQIVPVSSISSLIKQRKFEDAIEECEKALVTFPNHEKLLEKKIKIVCHQGRFDEAYSLALEWQHRDQTSPIAKKEVRRLKIVIEALKDQDSEEEEDDAVPAVLTTVAVSDDCTIQSSSTVPLTTQPSQSIQIYLGPQPDPLRPQRKHDSEDPPLSCVFCDVSFTSEEELNLHCKTDSHKKNITSDEGHDWKYRPPTRGLAAEDYNLCQRFMDNGRCPFGEKCTQAHSLEELEEWKSRFKFKRQQIQLAKEKHLHGNTFPEQLLEKLLTTEYPKSVMVKKVDYAKVIVNSDLNVNMMTKKCTNAWTFTVTSKVCVMRIVLLDEANCSHFYISSISVGPKKTQKYQNLENHCQEWKNPDLEVNKAGEYVYRVKVVFKTDIYGTFRQSLVFDFGSEPVLSREMCVESAPVTDTEKLTSEFKLSEQSRWRPDSVTVQEYKPKCAPEDAVSQALLFKYSLPPMDKFKFSEHLMQAPSKETYRLWMHQMLYIEELAQLEKIAKFNITTSLQLVDRFLLIPGTQSTAKFAQDGELFARMKLEDDLSVDSVEGRLIFQSANSVWIAPHKAGRNPHEHPSKVYEALVEDRGKNFVFLRISEHCVTELGLKSDQDFRVEVQFQLNRLPICEMHSAVDALPTLDLVFPKVAELQELPEPENWKCMEEIETKTNKKQREAITLVAAYSGLNLPPVLILGPFGTGKTYTLAQTVRQALQEEGTKMLICTHSNSAADLYIKDFLHPYVMEGNLEARPLRVLYRHRWIQTVSETVLQYCIQETSGAHLWTFRAPTREDLDNHRIVITTLSTARLMCDLDLPKGYFTHILVDEAAQALECETLIPLSLAGHDTRVVLAGDHMQMSPDTFSDFGHQQEFQKSLLERLYDFYPESSPCKIMLSENYRSNAAIVEFTSELFYDHKLTASLDPAPHGVYYPLTFFTARGEETQHENSYGYYNLAEIYEVVDQVDHLHKHWPPAWGQFDDNSICVVAPYTDQVIKIRAELRKRKLYKIAVERVVNIQGKQFRVIIISTVRTRHSVTVEGLGVEKLDYGFLSNIKLFNTAITRAESLVVVIGDPVSLCLVGKCSKVWEYYLEVCNENSSFFGMTWPHLRSLMNNVEMTKTYILNPLAPEFVPKSIQTSAQHGQPVFMAAGHPMPPYSGHRSAHYQQMYHPQYVPMAHPYNPYYNPHAPMIYRPPYSVYPRQHGFPYPGKVPRRGGLGHATVVRGQRAPLQAVHKEEVNRTRSESPVMEVVRKVVREKKNALLKARGVYAPRVPVQPYYMYPHYIPLEDPRYVGIPVQPPYYYSYGVPRPYLVQAAPSHPGSRMEPATILADGDSPRKHVLQGRSFSHAVPPSSTSTGQQIQLLGNVKHAPSHLRSSHSGSEDNSRSNAPVNPAPQLARNTVSQNMESPPNSSMDTELYRKRHHSGPRPVSQSPNYSSQSSHESSASPVLNEDIKLQQTTAGAGTQIQVPITTTAQVSSPKRQLKMRSAGLKLNVTGFSRQFSDELGTPTEITNLVRMIEENIDETDEEQFQSQFDVSHKPCPPSGKLYLNLTAPGAFSTSQSSSGSSEGEDSRYTYAGAVRHQLPLARDIQHQIDPALLEPQTPMTPAGFTTPSTDFTGDPLEILRNLQINNDNLNRSAHGHF